MAYLVVETPLFCVIDLYLSTIFRAAKGSSSIRSWSPYTWSNRQFSKGKLKRYAIHADRFGSVFIHKRQVDLCVVVSTSFQWNSSLTEKKNPPFLQSQRTTLLLPHPQNNCTSNPVFKKRNIQNANFYLLERNSLATYHTLQGLNLCVWLVNTLTSTADWFSDNMHLSTSRYLRTMWKEFKHSLKQTLVGQERVTNPWERLRGRLGFGWLRRWSRFHC